MIVLRPILGIAIFILICWIFSSHRKAISWKDVLFSFIMQIAFAILILKTPGVISFFEMLSLFFVKVLDFTREGSTFIFGSLLNKQSVGFIFAFQILPTIVFFSALTSLLYYLGILQKIVYVLAWILSRFLTLSGAESLSTASNIFLGQTESPLLIKPFLPHMSRSEILCVMIGGMSNIAGGVLAAYVGFLGGDDLAQRQMFATHLLCASIMSAPATIMISKLLEPELNKKSLKTQLSEMEKSPATNLIDSICLGTTEGVSLALNVGAMLLVFTSMVSMINYFTVQLGQWVGFNDIAWSLQNLFSWAFQPVAWIMGVSQEDLPTMAQLLGEKLVLNEFYAYTTLSQFKLKNAFSDPRTVIIATYALCGFANFASIGVQVGGISQMAPNQRPVIVKLGLKALLGGTICTLMTATLINIIF